MIVPLLLIAAARPAPAQTRPRLDQPFACDQPLTARSVVRTELERRLAPFALTDLPHFVGTEFRHDDERADVETLTLPDPAPHRRDPWAIKEWSPDAIFYDVGFRNLADDVREVNRFIGAMLSVVRHRSLIFRNDPRRVMWYKVIDRFRWEFHGVVLDDYWRRRSKQRLLGPDGLEDLVLATQHSNVDVFGVTRGFVPLTSTPEEIRRQLRISMQITHDQPREFTRFSLDGLLSVRGEPPITPRQLPFMYHLSPFERDDVIEQFWADYGHLRVCEFGRYMKVSDTPDWIEARLQLAAFQRAILRRCQLIVAAFTEATFDCFARRRLVYDRELPSTGPTREFLVSLRTDSPAFFLTLADLRREAGLDRRVYPPAR